MHNFIQDLKRNERKTGDVIFNDKIKSLKLIDVSVALGNTSILKNVSMEIHQNETLALVGESGSGKTTVMNILCGLLRPSSGVYTIENVHFQHIDVEAFQKRIGYITQEAVIFDDTIFNNVTSWDLNNSETLKRFHIALKQASIFDFVQNLEEKENTRLGNNGINLSGGQKQRIAIARELYKDVEFIFLDEATSALDSETEAEIQKSIEKLKGKYTIFIIAHRLSTIKHADRIVVMRNGQIEESGNFERVLFNSPSLKRMIELQEIV